MVTRLERVGAIGHTRPLPRGLECILTRLLAGPSADLLSGVLACRRPKCRFKLSCSRFHGEGDNFAINCQCDVEHCPLGHPHRAARRSSMGGGVNPGLSPMGGGAGLPGGHGLLPNGKPAPPPRGGVPPPHYTCNKCGLKGHYLNECPDNVCHKCGLRGHIATYCQNPRGLGSGGGPQDGNKRPFPGEPGGGGGGPSLGPDAQCNTQPRDPAPSMLHSGGKGGGMPTGMGGMPAAARAAAVAFMGGGGKGGGSMGGMPGTMPGMLPGMTMPPGHPGSNMPLGGGVPGRGDIRGMGGGGHDPRMG